MNALCLNLGKFDGSAFLEGLLGCDRDANGLNVVQDSVNKCLLLSDECVIVALKEEVCGLCGLDGLGSADESFVLKMVVVLDSTLLAEVVLDSTLLAENFDSLVIAVRSLTAVVDDADCAVGKLQSDDCGINIIIVSITGIRQDSTGCGDLGYITAGQITGSREVTLTT